MRTVRRRRNEEVRDHARVERPGPDHNDVRGLNRRITSGFASGSSQLHEDVRRRWGRRQACLTRELGTFDPPRAEAHRRRWTAKPDRVPPAPPRQSTASPKSPVISVEPAIMRLPSAWPASPSPPAKRYWNTPASGPSSSAASATRQLRTSPGGKMPSWRRSTPDEPPSSAMVTTALVFETKLDQAAKHLRQPGASPDGNRARPAHHSPPGRVRCRGARRQRGTRTCAGGARSPRQAPRSVHPTGAAQRDRHVGLALGEIARHDTIEQVEPAAGSRRSLPPHQPLHVVVEPCERAQLGDVERVGKKADVRPRCRRRRATRT